MKRKRKIIAALLLLLLLGAVWLGWNLLFGGRHLARAEELRAELRGEASRALSPEERRAKYQELRTEMDQLSPQQRNELGKERRQRMQQRLKDYFALSPKDRIASLDKDINRRTAQQQQRGQQNGNRGSGTGNGRSGPPGVGPQARQGPPRGPGPQSPENRMQRRMAYLDNTTPEERAQVAQYRQDMRQRMQQRGLPVGGRP